MSLIVKKKNLSNPQLQVKSPASFILTNILWIGKKRKLVRRISSEDSEDEYTPTDNNKEDDDVFDDISDTELMEIERDIATSKNRIPVTPIAEKFQVKKKKKESEYDLVYMIFFFRNFQSRLLLLHLLLILKLLPNK